MRELEIYGKLHTKTLSMFVKNEWGTAIFLGLPICPECETTLDRVRTHNILSGEYEEKWVCPVSGVEWTLEELVEAWMIPA